MLFPPSSANQTLPSGPAAMPTRLGVEAGTTNSSIDPPGVMRPTALPKRSVNHRLPSAPAVMSVGWRFENTNGNSVNCPEVVIRPIRFPVSSVNHRAPSGPAAIPIGPDETRGKGKLGDLPEGGDPSDPVPGLFGEPQGSVRAAGDLSGLAGSRSVRDIR